VNTLFGFLDCYYIFICHSPSNVTVSLLLSLL